MSALTEAARRRPTPRPADGTRWWIALGVAATAAAAGVGLAAVASGIGGSAALQLLLVVVVPAVLLTGLWAVGRPAAGVALVAVTLPVGLVELPGGFLQVTQAALVGAIAIVALHYLAADRRLPVLPGGRWLVAFVLLVCVSVVGAPDRALAVRQAAIVVLGALFVQAVVMACRRLADVRRLVALLVLAGVPVSLIALTQSSSVSGSDGFVVAGATSVFSEHNQLGNFAAAQLMLSLGLLVAARRPWARVTAALAAVAALGALALALSRGGYIAVALGLVLFVAVLPGVQRVVRATAIPALVGVALVAVAAPENRLVVLVTERLASFGAPDKNPYDARPQIWAEAGRQVLARPLTGTGAGNYPVAATSPDSPIRFGPAEHAHNVLLTAAAEAGLPAALLMVLLTLLWAGYLYRALRRLGERDTDHETGDAALLAGLGAALATFVAQGLVDVTFRSPVLVSLFCLCLGLALAAARLAGARVPAG